MIPEQEFKELKKKEKLLKQATEILKVQDVDLPRVVKRFLDEIKEFDEKIKNLNKN
ncbi:MAG: hypothetical protein QMD36_00435 [Candidatus Aenigmarchaeota archaeon]|nr:hypothetical protein [Candidatus Aenigmarchaeota archaeon]